MKSSIQKSAKPLEGTPLRRRPTRADAVGWKQHRLTLSLLVVCFLDSTDSPRQARDQSPSTAYKVLPSLASTSLLDVHIPLAPHTPGTGATVTIGHSLNPLHPNPSHSVPQLGCSLHLRSLPLFSPWWITYSLKTTHLTKLSLIKKQPQ